MPEVMSLEDWERANDLLRDLALEHRIEVRDLLASRVARWRAEDDAQGRESRQGEIDALRAEVAMLRAQLKAAEDRVIVRAEGEAKGRREAREKTCASCDESQATRDGLYCTLIQIDCETPGHRCGRWRARGAGEGA